MRLQLRSRTGARVLSISANTGSESGRTNGCVVRSVWVLHIRRLVQSTSFSPAFCVASGAMPSTPEKAEIELPIIESMANENNERSGYHQRMARSILWKFDIHILPSLALVSR